MTVIALSGGVGGAKLALGLSQVLPGEELRLIVNTGDDFEHLGQYICPDIDTLIYTLGGVVNPQTGWGRAGESWQFMKALKADHPDQAWFQLGDKDLQTHRKRTAALLAGRTLSSITAELTRSFAVDADILPMSDDPVRTMVLCDSGHGEQWLPFQEYFVRLRCEPVVKRIEFRGAEQAALPPALKKISAEQPPRAVIFCPSNPYLSIDPILSVPGMSDYLNRLTAPRLAVSPIIAGKAIKGPTAKIMHELGIESDACAVARHYSGLLDGLLIDTRDEALAGEIEAQGLRVHVCNTLMRDIDDKIQLAREVLSFADSIRNDALLS